MYKRQLLPWSSYFITLLTFCQWYHFDFHSLLTFICSQPHDIDLLFGLPSWFVFLHLASPCNLYPVQIHFYHNFIVHNFALPYCFDSQRPMSYWVATISSFVTWIHGWCVVNICINSGYRFLNYWLFFYDIQLYSFLCHQYLLLIYLGIMFSDIFELLTWLIAPFFLHHCFTICYLLVSLNPYTSKYLLHCIDDPIFQCYLWISYCCYHLLPLTWLPIAKFNRYPIELLNLRLSHLASCYSCYISWFKMPFVRNSFTDHFLHKLFLYIQLHFVSNLFCLYKLHFLIHCPLIFCF